MLARASRAVLAMALTATAGALGFALLWAGGAQALGAGSCSGSCPPSGTITGFQTSSTGGTITVTWSPNEPLGVVPSGLQAPTIGVAWTPAPGIEIPSNAPQPSVVTLQDIAANSCTGTAPMTCTYSFPSKMMVDGYVLNGTYLVSASAVECPVVCTNLLGHSNASSPEVISMPETVMNPPAAPTGVKAVPTAGGSQVTISWAPNPEPDIADYQVVRNDGTVVCTVAPTTPVPPSYSCTDAPTKNGSYSYEVVVFRYGTTYTNSVANDAITHGVPTSPVVVTGTSANTSTTVAGKGGLGSAGFAATPSPDKNAKSNTGTGTFNAAPPPVVVAPATGTTVDPGFEATLPYGTTVPPTPGTNPTAIAAPSTHKGSNSVGTIAAVGAGLLIAVIALHGLWLRAEVRRSGALEVLEPEH